MTIPYCTAAERINNHIDALYGRRLISNYFLQVRTTIPRMAMPDIFIPTVPKVLEQLRYGCRKPKL